MAKVIDLGAYDCVSNKKVQRGRANGPATVSLGHEVSFDQPLRRQSFQAESSWTSVA